MRFKAQNKSQVLGVIGSHLTLARSLANETGSDVLSYLIDMAKEEVAEQMYDAANDDNPPTGAENGGA